MLTELWCPQSCFTMYLKSRSAIAACKKTRVESSSNNNSGGGVVCIVFVNMHGEIGRTLCIGSYKLNSEHLSSYTYVEKAPEPDTVPLLNVYAYDQQQQLDLNYNPCWS